MNVSGLGNASTHSGLESTVGPTAGAMPLLAVEDRATAGALAGDGRRRVVIEGVSPAVDGGRYAAKRTIGEQVVVEADIFADGHDKLAAALYYRHSDDRQWTVAPMQPLVNDRWRGSFRAERLGQYRFTLVAWVDHFATWQRDLKKRIDAGQDVQVELLGGAEFLDAAAARAGDAPQAAALRRWAQTLRGPADDGQQRLATGDELAAVMARYPDLRFATPYGKELPLSVEREKARFSAWYELFPRSIASEPGRHGTFADLERRIADIAELGFDVLYLPPIHPIGKTKRKGRNNAPQSAPSDPGSPWAIGSDEGGHTAVHPALGTIEDFGRLVKKAEEAGVEIAMDLAFQCSPDHPYVQEHPEWFRWRPDGTVRYAENPPKRYEDIYPFHFESDAWRELWQELADVVFFWIDVGVKIFRVDNPHTKPFPFWEWLLAEVKRRYPEAIFLAEAFSRPRVKYVLAKLGFSQSYTYFTWRNTKWELTQYCNELFHTGIRDFCRPNFWPNTPDILPEYLQFGGRPAFMARLVLAATLAGNYGIYGPPFERYIADPREPGSEEYRDSEKYEIKHWDDSRPGNLREFLRRINRIRRENAALANDASLVFRNVDNEQIIAYTKQSEDGENWLLIVVNLDPYHTQSGWVEVPVDALQIGPQQPYQAHDLLGDGRYLWQGPRNFVELDPKISPAQIFRLRRRLRSEHQFEYFL